MKQATDIFQSGQSADRALAMLCERLVIVTPELLRNSLESGARWLAPAMLRPTALRAKARPEGLVENICNGHT